MKIARIPSKIYNNSRLALFSCRCKICFKPLVFEDEDLICRECKDQIIYIDAPVCKRCGKVIENRHRLCGECIVHPPPYCKHFSYSIYEGVLKDIILLFKYGEIKRLKKLITDYYAAAFKARIAEEFDFLMPVPADKNRIREFHPIAEIAGVLSGRLKIKMMSDNLVKVKTTGPQAGLSRSKRLKNLAGAFALKDPGKLKGKRILLIDDVYTTGTTIKQCAKVLVKAEADVVALTLARSM